MKFILRVVACLMICLLTLTLLPAALAESEDALLAQVRQIILDRCQTNNVDIAFGDQVSAENYVDYQLLNLAFFSADGNGAMRVEIYLTVAQGASATVPIGIMNYNFILMALPQGASSLNELEAYLPTQVINMTGDAAQALNWPVALSAAPLTLCLTYTVPKTRQQFGLVETNLYGESVGELNPAGPLYTYSFSRCANDFNLINDSSRDIAEFYAVPDASDPLGENLVLASELTRLSSGNWMSVLFDNGAYADTASENWYLKFVFADGTSTTFEGLDMANILDLYLQEEDGQLKLYAQY